MPGEGNLPKGRGKTQNATVARKTTSSANHANLGFEVQLFLAADKLRKNLEPSDYKHVCLGLIFLKHISNAFEAKRSALLAEDAAAAEDPDEYLAENVFWVPRDARWSHLWRLTPSRRAAHAYSGCDARLDLSQDLH
jgi:type I restriction enzyme M protein